MVRMLKMENGIILMTQVFHQLLRMMRL